MRCVFSSLFLVYSFYQDSCEPIFELKNVWQLSNIISADLNKPLAATGFLVADLSHLSTIHSQSILSNLSNVDQPVFLKVFIGLYIPQ